MLRYSCCFILCQLVELIVDKDNEIVKEFWMHDKIAK